MKIKYRFLDVNKIICQGIYALIEGADVFGFTLAFKKKEIVIFDKHEIYVYDELNIYMHNNNQEYMFKNFMISHPNIDEPSNVRVQHENLGFHCLNIACHQYIFISIGEIWI